MTNTGKNGSVEFRFYRPGVREVTLAGDFSDGSPEVSMRSEGHGWGTLTLELKPGEYRFRYLAAGQSYADFASNGVEASKTGWNSVLVIPGNVSARQTEVRQTIKGGALKVA